jgi:hypothetical protein
MKKRGNEMPQHKDKAKRFNESAMYLRRELILDSLHLLDGVFEFADQVLQLLQVAGELDLLLRRLNHRHIPHLRKLQVLLRLQGHEVDRLPNVRQRVAFDTIVHSPVYSHNVREIEAFLKEESAYIEKGGAKGRSCSGK